MFPKINRLSLREQKDFFQTAQRRSFSSFKIFWKFNDLEQAQFSVIVPKKVSLKSTSRHKILRQMRVLLHKHAQTFAQKSIVVVMFPNSLRKEFSELEKEISRVKL